ncbi:hypothetical protein IV203_034575 [Nitzschia inconspicua]|uniref:Uncharacterized protein n=1 Tax=Nitzschia inconspicua TaxID=303405 RepID=A0A9K3LCB0_9STRA|nr:hypothetical protein IV203_034575 [Nitzschia inconspicua]
MQRMVHMTGVGTSEFETTPIRSNKAVGPPFKCFLFFSDAATCHLSTIIVRNRYAIYRIVVGIGSGSTETAGRTNTIHARTQLPKITMPPLNRVIRTRTRPIIQIQNRDWSIQVQPPLGMNFTPTSFSFTVGATQIPTPVSTLNAQIPTENKIHNLPLVQACSFSAATLATPTKKNETILKQKV